MAPPPPSKRPALANVRVEDARALECGVCWLPLRPLIFQCAVGHALCRPCRDKLAASASDKCHVCRAPTTGGNNGGYRRCHDLETLVESIRVPCPNAAHGCAATPPYYDHADHVSSCPHAPCHCPAAEACGGFASSSRAAFLDHFTGAAHRWPCTRITRWRWTEAVPLHDGFNLLDVVNDGGGSTHLCLLLVSREGSIGRAVSAVCVDGRRHRCKLKLEASRHMPRGSDLYRRHCQKFSFRLASDDLSRGMPDPDDCFRFLLPKSLEPDENGAIRVAARLYSLPLI